MSIDYRALCEELLNALTTTNPSAFGKFVALEDRARAALAEPEPGAVVPTDEELDALWFEIDGRQGLGWKSFARAVLARWGNHSADASKMVSPAPVPADGGVAKAPAVTEVIAWLRTEAEIDDGFELTQSAAYQRRAAELLERQVAPVAAGEVTELVEGLKLISDGMDALGHESDSWFVARAADLLSIAYATGPEVWEPIPLLPAQRHPTPVPVSERLPGPGDCDAEGRCWLHLPDMGTEPLWRLTDPSMRSRYHSHWLPFHALPLPAGEVQP